MVYKNAKVVLLLPYLFIATKICGHRCGWNQFLNSPYFLYILMVSYCQWPFFHLLFIKKFHILLFSRFTNWTILSLNDGWYCIVVTFHFYKLSLRKLHPLSLDIFWNEIVINLCPSLSIILHKKKLKLNFQAKLCKLKQERKGSQM